MHTFHDFPVGCNLGLQQLRVIGREKVVASDYRGRWTSFLEGFAVLINHKSRILTEHDRRFSSLSFFSLFPFVLEIPERYPFRLSCRLLASRVSLPMGNFHRNVLMIPLPFVTNCLLTSDGRVSARSVACLVLSLVPRQGNPLKGRSPYIRRDRRWVTVGDSEIPSPAR